MASKKSHFGFGKISDPTDQPRKSRIKMRILEPRLTPSGLFDSGDFDNPAITDLSIEHHGVNTWELSDSQMSVPVAVDIPNATEPNLVAYASEIQPIVPEIALNPNELAQFNLGVFTVGETGTVSIDFLYDGGGYQGQLAIFSLEGMEAFDPNSTDFIHEAATRALSNSELGHIVIDDLSQGAYFNSTDNSGLYGGEQLFEMKSGDRFGLMLVPNGTVEAVFDNPDIEGALRPLFSLATANPDNAFHAGQVADVMGDGRVFVFEDLRVDTGSDGDFNDLVFHVKGATGQAATFDQLIADGTMNPAQDWRTSELGDMLIGYAYSSSEPPNNALVISSEILQTTDLALTDLATVISSYPNDLVAALNSAEANNSLTLLENALSDNPSLLQAILQSDNMSQLSEVGATTLQQLLQSPEVGEIFLNKPIPLEIALTKPEIWDAYLVNAQDAIALLPPDANQPLVGFLDFSTGLHDQYGLDAFSIINPVSQPEIYDVNNGNWAEQLIAFVNDVKASGNNYGIANFGGDLTQIDGEGRITTRYELTVQEQLAIKYARENNVLLVVAAGNTGDRMSALGAASQLFGNIITVGAVNNWEDRASYSSQGEGLTLVAPGGEFENDPKAFVGTSRASAEVSGAASLIWAANPLLSPEQVKQILISTARDLREEGWDAATGAGLIDVKEAVLVASAIAPAKPSVPKEFELTSFSGEGRVSPIERPASPSTEQAIATLADRQNLLFDQWQTLTDSGIPALTLGELQTKTNSAFDKYEQVTRDAAIADARTQIAIDEFVLAANHAQIYREQLQSLEARKQDLEQQLAQLSQDKTSLVAYTQQLLESLQADIGKTTEALQKAEAKLQYLLIDPQGLQADPLVIAEAAVSQQALAQVYRDQAESFKVEAQNYAIAAQQIQTTQWMIVGQQTNRSGRTQDIWGWGDNPQAVAAKNKALWQADIAERNHQAALQIASKLDQQVEALNIYAQVLTTNNNALPDLEGTPEDAPQVLALLKAQIEQLKQTTENYFQEAALAEQWRKTNQDQADLHNSLIQRWEVVGSKRGRSGKGRTDIYDWRYYPEHIAPRDQAQALATEAETKRKTFEQLAQTTQQQLDSLTVRAETLERSIRDWDVLKQGIDYEIDARQIQLQANQDALKLNSEVQPQKIAELEQKINSIQAELDRLQSQLLPPQIQSVNETEQRLQQAQDNLVLAQTDKSAALDQLQNFLETSGYFLPYQERLAAIARTIERIQTDQLQTQEIITQLITQLAKTPNETLQAQLEQAKSIQTNLEQEYLWARVQQEQLKLSVPDSPERLQTSSLVQQLIELKADLPNTDLPTQQYLDFLKQVDGNETSFLVGFDKLGDRFAKAKVEQTAVTKLLESLQAEYIELGLAVSALNSPQSDQVLKTSLENQLGAKFREIEIAKEYALQAQAEANRLQSRLDLLNSSEVLGAKAQTAQTQWQQATQALTTAVNALLTTRHLGEADRNNLANLQKQLTEKQAELEKAISKQVELKTGLDDATQALEFSKLQLGNQLLLKQSLADRDAPLKSAEAYFYNLAQQDRQQLWYWNGKQWIYNNAKAEAYRQNLQTASFLAEQRNQVWSEQQKNAQRIAELAQQVTTQTDQVASKTAEVKAANEKVSELTEQVDALKAEIAPIKAVLQPLIDQEKAQLQAFQTATTTAQSVGTQLSLTMQEQASALRRLIGFGVLASESDVDFFATDVEPKVNSFITQLQQQIQNFTTQANNLSQLIASWEEQLAGTTDPVIQKSLTDAIAQATSQRTKLEAWKADNQQTLPNLQELLTQAIAALTPLRQKQELEIKQKLEDNEQRLEALQSQQATEAVLKNALQANTELSYAQLNSQVNQDLRNTALAITDQLLESDRQTHEGITQQLSNSQAIDGLLSLITTTLAATQGNYDRSQANLRDGINILSKVVPIESQLDATVTTTSQAIDRIKFDIAQSNALWTEIAPIAIRYGLESEELKQYQAGLTDPVARASFLASHPNNGTAIALLQAATLQGSDSTQVIADLLKATKADVLLKADAVEGSSPNQLLYEKAKAAEIDHRTQGITAIIQADWYEKQAAVHWARSRKNGPYWYEQRWVKGRKGRGRWETITHVDQDWLIWNTYANQLVPQLRQNGAAELAEAEKWRLEKERLEPLAKQWGEANLAANEAAVPIQETRNLFEVLKTARESIPVEQAQLVSLENLLPIIEQQLAQSKQEADAANIKVQQEWEDYDRIAEQQEQAIAQILTEQSKINHNAIAIQQQLAEDEKWVERQSIALSTELEQTKVIQQQLQSQRQAIDSQIRDLVLQGITTDALDSLLTKAAQIDRTLPLITNKATILTAQQTALTQKRTLLTAQNEVIIAEQRLIEAYINDPSGDYSDLLQQLQDTRAILAEAQRLAEQAAASSQALTAPLQDLQTSLLVQNDEHLKTAREHQAILKALVKATELNANYALEAAKTHYTVNVLEFQILQRLQEATAAGYQEAKYLLEVARTNNIASAAEIYYRDYSDLASDRGGKCTGGTARPEDRILADRYYAEMLTYRQLQQNAQAQADAFNRAKTTAQNQLDALQTEQATASQALNDLNNKLAETQAEREAKEQELAVIQARLDGITRIREQTEQTFYQLVTLENLNLGQAQLEQKIAQLRQGEIDQAVSDRLEREALEVERKRAETQTKIEQLRQLQAEEELRQSLNTARTTLGLATLDSPEDPAQLDMLLAGLLTSLKDLDTQQPDLPADVKAVLAETRGDIYLALQGKSAETIQDSLLSAMAVLIGQVDQYKAQINAIDLDEQLDNQLLQQSQQDLQNASKQLLEELKRSQELGNEQQVINPLYIETLTRIAYAEQAVDISNDLAAQGREMLDQIIKQRVAERKARKKAFWQKVLGIISTIIGVLGAILSFTPLAPLGIALTAASAGINAIQSLMNGDWIGGIFSIVMAGINAVTAGMGSALSQGAKLAIQGLQSVAAGALQGVRSIMSGDSIMGFLQILSGVASAATAGLSGFITQSSSTIQKVLLQVFNSLKSVPTMIYTGIQAIENGDWLSAIGNIFNSVITLGSNFAGVFNSTAQSLIDLLGKVGNTGLIIGGAIENGGVGNWLSGIASIAQMWAPDIFGLIDRLNGEPVDPLWSGLNHTCIE